MKLLKKVIKYFLLFIISIIILNFLSLIIWGKVNLLNIAARNFVWNSKDYKVNLIIWGGISSEEDNGSSLSDFSNSQIKDFINSFYKKKLAVSVRYKPEKFNSKSIKYVENELNLSVQYKMKYLFYCETYIFAYEPGFYTDKTEYLYWFFGWHKFSEPQIGIT